MDSNDEATRNDDRTSIDDNFNTRGNPSLTGKFKGPPKKLD